MTFPVWVRLCLCWRVCGHMWVRRWRVCEYVSVCVCGCVGACVWVCVCVRVVAHVCLFWCACVHMDACVGEDVVCVC